MPRSERKKSETGIYHICLRGINQQRIFEDASDNEQFLAYLQEVKDISQFKLYAFCLMGNHAHFLLEEGAEPLAQIFKRLGARYVFWFNWKYQRQGHLFQDRFRSKPVQTDAYFLTALNYIHSNPVKAGLCKAAADYRWSSLSLLESKNPLIDWLDLEKIVPISDFEHPNHEPDGEDTPFGAVRMRAYSDNAAQSFLESISGTKNTAEFQKLAKDVQRLLFPLLREAGMPIRQIARITGSSKAIVERWSAKKDKEKDKGTVPAS